MPGNLNLVEAQDWGCPRSQKKSSAVVLYKSMALNSLSDLCIYAHRLVLLSAFVRDASACSGQNWCWDSQLAQRAKKSDYYRRALNVTSISPLPRFTSLKGWCKECKKRVDGRKISIKCTNSWSLISSLPNAKCAEESIKKEEGNPGTEWKWKQNKNAWNTLKAVLQGKFIARSSIPFFFFLKFHTLKKNQKEQQISVLMIWLKMLKIRANQIQTQLMARHREN